MALYFLIDLLDFDDIFNYCLCLKCYCNIFSSFSLHSIKEKWVKRRTLFSNILKIKIRQKIWTSLTLCLASSGTQAYDAPHSGGASTGIPTCLVTARCDRGHCPLGCSDRSWRWTENCASHPRNHATLCSTRHLSGHGNRTMFFLWMKSFVSHNSKYRIRCAETTKIFF